MVRKKTDPFWKHVEVCPNKDRWKCKFCHKKYPGHASRIKAHLGQVKNRGIEICDKVDESVKKEALRALHKEEPDKQQHVAEETTQQIDQEIGSDNNPYVHPPSDHNLLQDYQPVYKQYASGEASYLVVPEASLVPLESNESKLHARLEQADPLPNSYFQKQSEVNAMISTAQDLQCHSTSRFGVNQHSVSVCTGFDQNLLTLKRKLRCLSNRKEEKEEELYQWSKKVKTIKNIYQRMTKQQREGKHPAFEELNQVNELISQAEELDNFNKFDKEALRTAACSKGPALLTSKLIVRDNDKSKIQDSLVSDGIFRVAVYGMGGVGKTEIMMNIYNELLDDEAFDNVFWVTVPKDFSVYELQSVIGNALHLEELSNEKNEKIRAAILHRFLTSGKKYVIILDGLWRHFNYKDVGIPLKYNGLKLVITCRSLVMSRVMLCQKRIKISPLVVQESNDWDLFLYELGVETGLPKDVATIAKNIVKACGGLPLYIKAIAIRMRGVEDVQEWSDIMEKMNYSKEKSQVLDCLKLSYDFLGDHHLQQCLIFCAFYCESRKDAEVREVEEFLVDMGLIDGRNNRKELLHKAHNSLRELENACLLSVEGKEIKMHDSIIDMALRVATNANLFMVDFDISSLHEEFQDLDAVSLMRDATMKVVNLSPTGFRLPIMISQKYYSLGMIPNSLFSVFYGLSILNLSSLDIQELPNSVSHLNSLTALVLRECYELCYIPYVGNLTLLRKLDLYRCKSLKDLPYGLECLANLEHLDFGGTGVVELPKGVLRTLKELQYLRTTSVEAKELEGLANLEAVHCQFSTFKELTIFVKSFNEKGLADTEYVVFVRKYDGDTMSGLLECCKDLEEWREDYKRIIVLNRTTGMERDVVGLENVERLEIYYCIGLECLIGPGVETRFSFFPYLRKIKIKACPDLQRIIAAPSVLPSFHGAFPRLETIDISFCDALEEIIATSSSKWADCSPTVTSAPTHISDLKSITMSFCCKMKRLINHDMLPLLCNLRFIKVSHCYNMEEITSIFNKQTPLPNLKILHLEQLPKLRSIGVIAIGCPIETIIVHNCPKIRSIPLQMHQLQDGVLAPPSSLKEIVISRDDKEWWESLEWDFLEAKAAFEPYVHDPRGMPIFRNKYAQQPED